MDNFLWDDAQDFSSNQGNVICQQVDLFRSLVVFHEPFGNVQQTLFLRHVFVGAFLQRPSRFGVLVIEVCEGQAQTLADAANRFIGYLSLSG